MKYGNITQTAWQRSVRRQLHTKRPEVISRVSPWERCFQIASAETEDGAEFLWSDACASGESPMIGYYAVRRAAGELAAKGAEPCAVSAHILFPQRAEEKDLRELTEGIETACRELNIQIAGVQGETLPSVIQNTVMISTAGMPCKTYRGSREAKGTEQEILMCGYAGLEGMLRILDEAEEELQTRFVSSFLAQAKELKKELVLPEQILKVFGCAERGITPVTEVRQIGSGGILAALWELAEELGTGFEVDMKAIALKQETVEICEFFRLNPYQMTSAGSFLIVARDAEPVMEILEKAGARAIRLGVTKAQNARVITSGEEARYLDRPAPDELISFLARAELLQ